jgi:hypothetical protein
LIIWPRKVRTGPSAYCAYILHRKPCITGIKSFNESACAQRISAHARRLRR